MGVGIEVNGLVAAVIACHVALAAVDAQLVVHQSYHLEEFSKEDGEGG